jgi:hypothetical protein
MKKVGLIAIALVTVLATLGIGFSMWSQTAIVTGHVSSGSISLKVSDPTCDVYFKDLVPTGTNSVGFEWSGYQIVGTNLQPVFTTNAYGTIPVIDTTKKWPIYPLPTNSDFLPYPNSNIVMVGWGAITGFTNNANGSATVNAQWQNLFPWTYDIPTGTGYSGFSHSMLDFFVTNTGTVPVLLNIANLSTGNIANMPIEIGLNNDNGEWTSLGVHNVQLEPGHSVDIGIALVESEGMTQGYNGTFTFTITGTQWNEPVTTTATP